MRFHRNSQQTGARWPQRLLAGLGIALVMGGGCARSRGTLVFPTEQVQQARADVATRSDRLQTLISRIEAEISLVSAPPPDDWFSTDDLHFARFTFVECFVSPVCKIDDPRGICVDLAERYPADQALPMGLDAREASQNYLPCPIRDSVALAEAEGRWSEDAKRWFRARMEAIDYLRIRLRAIIPDRAVESEQAIDGIDNEVRQLYIEAEDQWRASLRQEMRSEQRRAEEERWERFLQDMAVYEEELAGIRSYMEELRTMSRLEVLRIATRLATLGEPRF